MKFQQVKSKDFVSKTEKRDSKQGKRQYLNKQIEDEFTAKLNALFRSMVNVPRVKVGKQQEVESLINEEALLLAKFVRNETTHWQPRIPQLG
jgi:CRISPR/Cas system-associated endonuclease Cas1